jgi:predicted ATPase/DNA-binding SARP family transcriptional activator
MALLAYLAVTCARHSRAALAALLWPESDARRSQSAMRSALSSLRRALDGAWLVADHEAVGLDGSHRQSVDVVRFRDLLQRCRVHSHLADETCVECTRLLTTAVALYEGDFMSGFALRDSPQFDDWQCLQAEAVRRELAGALARLAEGHAAWGDVERGITYAKRWLTLNSLDERAHRALMRLYAGSGQQAAALAQYETCQRTLREQLSVSPSPETMDLHADIREGRIPRLQVHAPSLSRAQTVPRHNLPPQPTPFVGRIPELAKVTQFLADPACRLLTVVGPGGVGKSRLAIQASAELVPTFTDGVWFVPLAGLDSADRLAATILDALPISAFGSTDPEAQLLNSVQNKRLLILLDNFEHLMDGTPLLTRMLDRAPGLKVLVTSRERLNLRGEWLFPLRGMRVPTQGTMVEAQKALSNEAGTPSEKAVSALKGYSALQLFAQCARRVRPDFSLASAAASGAVRICQLVEGMPLAIELAAPWVRIMPCHEIAQEIEGDLGILTTTLRDVPQRHRSMRAVFDHSWGLLSVEERDVLMRLSVFRGGFDREAAGVVAVRLGQSPASLALLSALVDKSWLRAAPSGRYDMHELIRQYAAENLRAGALNHGPSGEERKVAESARDRHTAYYAAFLSERKGRLKGRGQKEALQEILADIDNVRAAWRWATDRADAQAIGRCIDVLWYVSDLRGWHLEVVETFGRAAARLSEQVRWEEGRRASSTQAELTFVLAQVLSRQGHQCNRLGLRKQAIALCEESLALLEQAGQGSLQQKETAWEKLTLGWTLLGWGDTSRGHRLFQEALAHAKATGDPWSRANALCMLGVTTHMQGRIAEAQRLARQGIAIADEIGEAKLKAWGLMVLADYVCDGGEYERAEALARDSLAILRELGDRVGTTYALLHLGDIAIAMGDHALARRCFQDSLAVANETDSVRYFEAWSLNGLAAIAHALGQHAEARQLYSDSVRVCEDIGVPDVAVTALTGLGNVTCLLGELGQSGACFNQALRWAAEKGCLNRIPEVLVGLAGLGIKEGGHERAVELLALVLAHPSSPHAVKDRAERLLDRVAEDLPPEVVAAAVAQGQAQELAGVAASLLESDIEQKGSISAH